MGFLSTGIAFAAGYAVRANRDSDMAQQITTKLREKTSQKIQARERQRQRHRRPPGLRCHDGDAADGPAGDHAGRGSSPDAGR